MLRSIGNITSGSINANDELLNPKTSSNNGVMGNITNAQSKPITHLFIFGSFTLTTNILLHNPFIKSLLF